MKKIKSAKGFTLVELVVVIAIIGVLAAILVPSMVGYVTKAKFASVNSSAKSLYNAAMTACREEDNGEPIPDDVYSKDKDQNTTYNSALCKHIYECFPNLTGCEWAVKIEGDEVVAVCLQKNSGDGFVGTYPQKNTEKKAFVDENGNIIFTKALEAANPKESEE